MGSNWFYNAIQNGIGGVNCGTVEGGHYHRDNVKSLRVKVEILEWLQTYRGGMYLEMAIKDGYIATSNSMTQKEMDEIIAYNNEINERKKDIQRHVNELRKAFMETFYPRERFSIDNYNKAVKGLLRSETKKKELHDEIEKFLEKIKSLPKQKKIGKDNYRLTDEGYETYKEMFDIGCNIRYIHKD
jgi:enoyl reductase-like protein